MIGPKYNHYSRHKTVTTLLEGVYCLSKLLAIPDTLNDISFESIFFFYCFRPLFEKGINSKNDCLLTHISNFKRTKTHEKLH